MVTASFFLLALLSTPISQSSADEGTLAMVDVGLDLLKLLGLELKVDVGDGGSEGGSCDNQCYDPPTIDYSASDMYCDQPLFINFITKTDAHVLIDNVCYTLFPLPDDPFTFNLYRSTVFCDGSTRVETAVVTDMSLGRSRTADPFCTHTSYVVGFAGCDTYIIYRCMEYGECQDDTCCGISVVGVSPSCSPLGLSCIQKVEEVLQESCLPKPEFIILPMKLPNRCVTEQLCINNIKGDFFKALNLPPPVRGLPPPIPALPLHALSSSL